MRASSGGCLDPARLLTIWRLLCHYTTLMPALTLPGSMRQALTDGRLTRTNVVSTVTPLFLGPQAENMELFQEMLEGVLDAHAKTRQEYNSEDGVSRKPCFRCAQID